jgi:hypothetical protein
MEYMNKPIAMVLFLGKGMGGRRLVNLLGG